MDTPSRPLTLLEQLAANAERLDTVMAEFKAAPDRDDRRCLERFKPLIEEIHAERDRLEDAHYGRSAARQLRYERKRQYLTNMVQQLRAVIQRAVDEDNWDMVAGLAPIIKEQTAQLARMSTPRTLRLVRDTD